jgi:ElaB/YqjD/DUF883 family membrane-anchored ribosome-binding protein
MKNYIEKSLDLEAMIRKSNEIAKEKFDDLQSRRKRKLKQKDRKIKIDTEK